jgi:hypothetical protein
MTDPAMSPANRIMVAVTHIYQEHFGAPPIRHVIAVALRAAADEVVPELGRPRTAYERTLYHEGRLDAVIRHRDHLLAISSELRGHV